MTTAREVESPAPAVARADQPARRSGLPHGPARLLALQRAAGNRAVAESLGRNRAAAAGADRTQTVIDPTAERQIAEEAAPARTSNALPPPPPPEMPGPRRTVQRKGLIDDFVEGATEVAGGVKNRIIGSVRDQAKSIPGYTLLTVVLGKDPITDAPVERNGAALINGFLDIIPGSEKIRGPLQESKAIDKAGAWFDAEVPKLGITWNYIKGLFDKVVGALGASDLLDVPGAVAKVVRVFSEPIDRLTKFGAGAVRTLLEFVVEGAMALAGGAGAQVMGIIKRAGAAFDRIVADPMGFLSNLIAAVKGGFLAFASNIGTHLKNGLIAWLTGSLGGIIRIPAKFDLPGVLGMVMDFLGLTWARVRGKLLKYIPDPILSKLEAAAGLIADLRKRGLAAITDRIAQFADGLVGTVMNGIKDWITNNIVTQAITKLISFFNPAGAIVQAAIAIYNTVMFFIERGKQIAALAESVFDSIEAIASGAIGGAVTKVEQALGRAVPVLLGFLARLIGLGDIATPVKKVMTEVQAFIDKALDKAIDWVAGIAKKIAGALGFGKNKKEGEEPAADLQPALKDAQALLTKKDATAESVRSALPGLRSQHSLKKAELHPAAGTAGAFQILVQRAKADTAPVPLASDVDVAAVKAAIGAALGEKGTADARHKAEGGEKSVVWASGGGRVMKQGAGEAPAGDQVVANEMTPWIAAQMAMFTELGEHHDVSQMTMLTDAAKARLGDLQGQLRAARTNKDKDAKAEAERQIGKVLRSVHSYVAGQGYGGRTKDLRQEHSAATGEWLPKRSARDQGIPGYADVVHAEKNVFRITGAQAIGVSTLPQCDQCQLWFKEQAIATKKFIVVASETVRVFLPNGEVKGAGDFK